MMSRFTPNYQLHQWDPEDNFLRTDFNEDLSKIDTALASKADNSAITNLQGQINNLPNSDAVANLQNQINAQQQQINSKPNLDAITNLQNQINTQQGQINGKANLDSITNLQSQISAQQGQINSLSSSKAEFIYGSYTGNGGVSPAQVITIGFQAKAIFVYGQNYTGLVDASNCSNLLTLTTTGFNVVFSPLYEGTPNKSGVRYAYLAMR